MQHGQQCYSNQHPQPQPPSQPQPNQPNQPNPQLNMVHTHQAKWHIPQSVQQNGKFVCMCPIFLLLIIINISWISNQATICSTFGPTTEQTILVGFRDDTQHFFSSLPAYV